MLPLEYLLPLRVVQITLQFTEATDSLRLFHQPALTAWLRYLVGKADIPHYEQYFTLDAFESGRATSYRAGDYYRFALLSLRGGDGLLQWILERLFALPYSVMVSDPAMPFRDNLRFVTAVDGWQQSPITQVAELMPYTLDHLQQEARFWHDQERCVLRWLSPVRLLLPPEQREGYKGERRYCRQCSQVSFSLLNNRLYDSLAYLLRSRVEQVPPRVTDQSTRLLASDLFWVDCRYHNTQVLKPMGGLLGQLVLDTRDFAEEQWLYWVLGQYLGIGQRRAFGWGRYQLEELAAGDG